VKRRLLIVLASIATLVTGLDAHFVLVSPAASTVQNRLGDPQKIGPCGGVSANAARGTPPNPGVPTNAITEMKGGATFHLLLSETVFHPGHYRVALARTVAELPPDPMVTTRDTEKGPWSVSAAIQNPAVAPVLADGLFAHTERPTAMLETDVPVPNINCKSCVLQVIQFMAEHARNQDGDYSYHHCAMVNITADPAKPLDTRWAAR
jgi:hypothetical protein